MLDEFWFLHMTLKHVKFYMHKVHGVLRMRPKPIGLMSSNYYKAMFQISLKSDQ